MHKQLFKVTFFFLVSLLASQKIAAQNINLQSPKSYIISNIEVTGIKNFSKQTVISFTGLFEGKAITIPGDEIPQIIRKLWKLQLFSDVSIYVTDIQEDEISLEIYVKELPKLADYNIEGVSRSQIRDLKKKLDLEPGKRINENFVTNTRFFITKKYKDKGFIDTKVAILLKDAPLNNKSMFIRIDRGKKLKINSININGNKDVSDYQVRSSLKKTKQKSLFRVFKRSKYIQKDYKEDLENMISLFKKAGYRDARVISDSLYRAGEYLNLDVNIEEGKKYYFGDINFIGNTVYPDRFLTTNLGIKKGDIYNGVLLDKKIADNTKPDAQDLTNLYQNNGYLFSRIKPVEVGVRNDTIDVEIRISEGKSAHFNNIKVEGNNRVNDHVIYRTLRTRPGELYSKANVVRTIRELSQLNFFDQEKIAPEFENVDPNNGTLDLNYKLIEKGSSQIQLQGGYGGGGFIGTVGLSFNNFSIRNIFNGKAYRPIPLGDGQSFSLRLQVSRFYDTFSLSFTEPWLGGKKPMGLSVSLFRSTNYSFDRLSNNVDTSRFFNVYGVTVGISERLRKPDDYFTLYQGISYSYYNLSNFNTSLFNFGNGDSNSLAYVISLGRNSSGPSPIYPLGGSNFSATLKLSPPYSLFDNVDYGSLETDPNYKLVDSEGRYIDAPINLVNPELSGKRVSSPDDAALDIAKIDQMRFKWLEFYKFKFSADWYLNIISKLVLRASMDFGVLGSYNNDRGLIPFERFFVGGTAGIVNTMDGRENIVLRGYRIQSLSGNSGSSVYNKFSMELRYPFTLKPSASIYGLIFAEGGSVSDTGLKDFNPFFIKRSAGVGVRIFMPAFGLLGFDFGYGFDPEGAPGGAPSGTQTHFIIGQNF